MTIKEDQLRKFILESGLVSDADISVAEIESKESNHTLGEILVSQGKISEQNYRRIQAYVLGIPFVSLIGAKINLDVLALIPEPIAKNNNVVA